MCYSLLPYHGLSGFHRSDRVSYRRHNNRTGGHATDRVTYKVIDSVIYRVSSNRWLVVRRCSLLSRLGRKESKNHSARVIWDGLVV